MNETENKEGEAAAVVEAVAPSAPGPSAEEEQKRLFDQLLRLKAEFENYRKRVDRDRPEWIRQGKMEVLERMIPLCDALHAARAQLLLQSEGAGSELFRGVEMIFSEFEKFFKAEGVEPIPTVGERLDFNRHEVLGQVESDAHDEGVVVDELQRGYLIGGRTLRAAKVRIAKRRMS